MTYPQATLCGQLWDILPSFDSVVYVRATVRIYKDGVSPVSIDSALDCLNESLSAKFWEGATQETLASLYVGGVAASIDLGATYTIDFVNPATGLEVVL